MSTGEVLARFTDGPVTGVFTDGASQGNPGPGGWGAVLAVDNQMVAQDCEHIVTVGQNKLYRGVRVIGDESVQL